MSIPLQKVLDTSKASLHFVDDQMLFVWRENGGERRHKFVSPAALRGAISREPVDSDWISPIVRRCGSGPRGNWAIAWFAPTVYKLSVIDDRQNTRAITVPLPGLVFAGAGKSYAVWATKGDTFSPDGTLFHLPLPNVESNGEICFGSNRVPPASASTIERAFSVFRDSPFNGHSVENKSKRHAEDVRQLLFELARAKERIFPEKDLVAAEASLDRMVDVLVGRRSRR